MSATTGGKLAQDAWRPLSGIIERRWEERFGIDAVAALRDSLAAVVNRIDADFPAFLPILGYDLTAAGVHRVRYDPERVRAELNPGTPLESGAVTRSRSAAAERAGSHADLRSRLELPALFSTLLFAFTLEFEHESDFALALGANALRAITENGVRLADLPRLTGVSKSAIDRSVALLEKSGCVIVGTPSPAGRTKIVRLTTEGRLAQDRYLHCVDLVEQRWESRFGAPTLRRLRASLCGVRDARDAAGPRLSRGLHPHPNGWRAHPAYAKQTQAVIADPHAALPHYPMVLHRGGWPDGS